MSKSMNTPFDVLITHAIESNDAVLYQLLISQTYHPRIWEEFLIDVILAQSIVNKSLRDQLVEAISTQPPKPILVSTKMGKFVPDGAWPEDYPEDDTPSGAWPR